MRQFLALLIIFIAGQTLAICQGCVAIKSTGSTCSMVKPVDDGTKWEFNVNYRYFKSFRHFSGTVEQKQRVKDHSDVRNYSNSLDLAIVRKLNSRWSLRPEYAIAREQAFIIIRTWTCERGLYQKGKA